MILAPAISRRLGFLPDFLRTLVAATLASQLASIPLLVSFFGYFPVLSILANVLMIPVITLAFYLLWAAVIICLILPVDRLIALYIPYIILNGTNAAANFFATFGVFMTKFPTALCYVYYPTLAGCSDAVNFSRKMKTAMLIVVAVCLSVAAFL